MSTRIKGQRCPTCNEELNACHAVQGTPDIRPGDFSICAYCGQVLVFDESLVQRVATENDLRGEDRETLEVILKARCAVMAIRAARN